MLATGVDLVNIARVERIVQRYRGRFLERIYTEKERTLARGRPAELAARFAAKEAVAKALGVGVRLLSPLGVGWHDVEVLNERGGRPYVVLHGRAQALAQSQGLTDWSISLSHDGGMAVAFVVAMGKSETKKGK
ncbi:MAG: holo-ACP synthase [Anaerolineae bacterium]